MSENGFWKDRTILVMLPLWSATFINKNFGKLIARLLKIGVQVHVYCAPSSGDELFRKTFPRAVLHNTRIDRRDTGIINVICLYYRFLRVIQRVKPDCVLWTYAGDRENLLLWILSWLKGVPYVIKCDSGVPVSTSNLWKRLRQWLFVKLPFARAALVLAETTEVLCGVKQACPDSKLYYFTNGVPVSEFREMKKMFENEDSPFRYPYMLFTGRIMYLKGVDLLIDAFLLIAHKIPEWRLIIVGDVWEEEFADCLRTRVQQSGLSERVYFQGFCTGKELARWYYFAEFYLLPSRHEGLANRLCEAMYFGLPVLAFDIGQTKALVTSETGILVEPKNVEKFSKGMLRLAQKDSLRQMLGSTATEIIETHHNDDVLFNNLFNSCEKIIGDLS